MYEQRWNHLSDGANVMFADLHVEWVQPYTRVLELVEQTRQRLATRDALSGPAPAVTVASRPAP